MAIVDAFIGAVFWLEHRVLSPLVDPVQMVVQRQLTAQFPSTASAVALWMRKSKSPLAEQLPLMNPVHVLALIVWYLAVVFGGKWVMSNVVRRKIDMTRVSQFHNAFMVWLSAYMAINVAYQAFVVRGYGLVDNPVDNTSAAVPLSKYLWLFYFSKPLEFMDTFIMVAKMNFRQVSFLHVYHHTSVFCFWWFVTYMAPMGEAYQAALLNSMVHVVMYSYYLFSSMGVAKSVMAAVKPFITRGQIFQFCLLMLQTTIDLGIYATRSDTRPKQYPVPLIVALWLYMWSMLALFGNFYRKNYTAASVRTPKSSSSQKAVGATDAHGKEE